MRALLASILVALIACQAGAGITSGGSSSSTVGSPIESVVVFTNTNGLQTSPGELDTFLSLEASDGGQYTDDLTALGVTALDSKDDWDWPLTAGAWESDSGRCEPVGETTAGQYLGEAAADIYAMALYGYLTSDDAYYAAAKTRLLQLAATTGFGDDGVFSGADQCALDLGTAVPTAIEASLILEAEYVNWSASDRLAIATWAAEETVPLTSWAAISRKNNWGFLGLGAMIATAYFSEGGIPLLDAHDGIVSPEDYLANADELLADQLATDDPLDAAAGDCSTAGQPYGLQTHGGFPDELRRTGDTADCADGSIIEVMGACVAAGTCATGTAHFYQQKATNAFARISEALRRIDGNGARGYDLTSHGGANEALYDAASFSTSGFTTFVQDTTMGFVHVAGWYYADNDLLALSDSANVPLRGGLDFPYTRITFAPGVNYEWSLGALDSYSSRLDVDWDHSAWANNYDTEAELNALGWTTVMLDETNPTAAIDCTAGGSESDEDEAALASILSANCSGGTCNNVFKIPADCDIDVTAAESNDTGAPAVQFPYSNFAIIGEDVDTSRLVANNTITSANDSEGPLMGNFGGGWVNGPESATASYTWDSGDTAVKGQSIVVIDDPDGSCSEPDAGSMVVISGTDGDGIGLRYTTAIVSNVDAGANCTLTIEDPLPTTYNSKVGVFKLTDRRTLNIFLDFTIAFPHIPPGICTNNGSGSGDPTDHACANAMKIDRVHRVLFDGMQIGPVGSPGRVTRISQLVVRNSTIGPHLHGMRRANNNNYFDNKGGSLMSYYNNVHKEGVVRISPYANAVTFAFYGFNYTIPQDVPNDYDTTPLSSTHYCNASFSVSSGIPGVGGGAERSYFINHDAGDDLPDGGSRGVGHFLLESNDLECTLATQIQNFGTALQSTRRYATFFRNRMNRNNGQFESWPQFGSLDYPAYYSNYIANRTNTWSFTTGFLNNGLGLFNVDPAGTFSAPSATGITWPTTGTGKNYVDAAEHDDYGSVVLPPSLAFRNDLPPSWWCQESGTWDGTWSFAYGDGGDNGGTPRKLPAQIRYEGGTCTPPSATVDYGTP